MLTQVKLKRDEKRKILDDQLNIIKAEKAKVDADVTAMQHQVEVRNITKKISDLNVKLDMVSTLSEPRENSYIEFLMEQTDDLNQQLGDLVLNMGQIKTSKTFPSLCRVTMDTAIANLEMGARLTTINYDGEVQTHGGDPVTAIGRCQRLRLFMISMYYLQFIYLVVDDKGERVPTDVKDKDDGTYEVKFTAHRPGTYCLKVILNDTMDCFLQFSCACKNKCS